MSNLRKSKLANALHLLQNSLKDGNDELKNAITEAIKELENDVNIVKQFVTSDMLDASIEKISNSVTEENKEAFEKFRLKMQNDFKNAKAPTNYLETDQAVRDFMNTVKGARKGGEQTEAWREKLIENEVKYDDGGGGSAVIGMPYPVFVMEGIQNAWKAGTGLFAAMTKISNYAMKVPYTESQLMAAGLRAKGHVPGATKKDMDLVVKGKQINIGTVYADVYVSRHTLVNVENDGALMRWIFNTAAENLAKTIEYVIFEGDPLTDDGTYGGDALTDLEVIGTKDSSDSFTIVGEAAGDAVVMKDIISLIDQMHTQNQPLWLVTSKSNVTAMREFVYASGGTTDFIPLDVLKGKLGVDEIKYFDFSAASGIEAILIVPSLYFRVGGEPFGEQWTMYETNKEALRSEIFMGGAIGGLLSTAVLKKKVT